MASQSVSLDALSRLPYFQWRGRKYPVIGHVWLRRWETTFHQTPSCQYPESVGPTNWRFDYTLAMRNGIAVKPYSETLFQDLLVLYADCANRERGELIDPLWGTWKCIAIEFSGDTDLQRRDGVDAKVAFVHKPELLDDPRTDISGGLATVAQLATEAGMLDEKVKVVFHERQKAPPEPLVDPLAAIAGFGQQIERAGDKISQSLHKFANRCESLERTVRALEDPKTFDILRALRRNRAAAHRLLKRINNVGRDTKRVVMRYQKAATTIAAQSGMTTQELLTLNPDICRTPLVPIGTTVTLYAR